MNDPFAFYEKLSPNKPFTVAAKKTIAKIDKKPRINKDKRCKLDKLLGIDKPITLHHSESQHDKRHAEEVKFQKMVEKCQKIDEMFEAKK